METPVIDPERKAELLLFARSAKIKFRDLHLLNLAFIHRSASNENGYKCNNERLEFLGDAILGAVTASMLYTGFPAKNEGDITKIKAIVVSAEILSSVARGFGIDKLMILGHGEELSGGRNKKNLLADTMEAVFGALYLDSGYKKAFKFIKECIGPEIEKVREKGNIKDYKSRFQEGCQKIRKTYPVYELVKTTGPEHDRVFWVEVSVDGEVFGSGSGKNKKSAEQEAAKGALQKLLEGADGAEQAAAEL